jgi:undecaprenyl phosphate-alpha-L-ara4N flippase subunit ArnE
MSGTLSLAILGLLGFCILAETGRELSFKAAADGAAPASSYSRSLALQPWLWAGLVFWAVEVVAWVLVLERAPLALAYPIMSLTYATVPLAGALMLGERVSRTQVLGIVVVAAGAACVGLSGR